jgi:hypothetical protein
VRALAHAQLEARAVRAAFRLHAARTAQRRQQVARELRFPTFGNFSERPRGRVAPMRPPTPSTTPPPPVLAAPTQPRVA